MAAVQAAVYGSAQAVLTSALLDTVVQRKLFEHGERKAFREGQHGGGGSGTFCCDGGSGGGGDRGGDGSGRSMKGEAQLRQHDRGSPCRHRQSR